MHITEIKLLLFFQVSLNELLFFPPKATVIGYWFRKGKGMWLKNKPHQNEMITMWNLIVWWDVIILYTLHSMGRKTIAQFFQRRQSRGRKVTIHCRTGKLHPLSELPEIFLSLHVDFIKPTRILLSLLFHSFILAFVFLLHKGWRKKLCFFFQNKHYSKASATPRVERFSVFCVACIWPLHPFTDGWLNAQGLLIGKYP